MALSLPSRLSALLLAAGIFHVHPADWPQFLGPDGDGSSPETGLLDAFPADGPRVLWSKPVGTGYSAPSVRDGQLVLFHREGDQEIIQSMDAATGNPGWRYDYATAYQDPFGYNNGPRCTPLLSDNRCFTFGVEGMLTALDRKTGARIWQRDTAAEFTVPEPFFGVGSTPILVDGLLITMVGGQPNSGVVAFDAATGKTVWENVGESSWTGQPMHGWRGERTVVWRSDDKQASYASPVLASFHGRPVVLCLMRQGLVALNPKTGEVFDSFWFRSTVNESVNAANPVVHGNQILISAAYYRVGSVLLEMTGEMKFREIWRATTLESHWATPILNDGLLYAFSGRNPPDASFRCVTFETGEVKWERDEQWRSKTPPPPVYGRGSLIDADGRLYALGECGLLGIFHFNGERPEELSRWQVPGMHYPCWTGPVLSNKRLFLRCEDRLICLDLAAAEPKN